ncbi:MAG: Hsp20/alpha crystallin family protein [Aureispira sp.]|nr:Hsp20/alpha crystallin family protein [Aureispira sp.]
MKLVKRNSRTANPFFNNFFADDFFTPFFSKPLKTSRASQLPAINIKEEEGDYTVEVAAPGMSKEDFKIEIDNDILTISTEKETSKEEKKGNYTYKEFGYSSFKRSFSLDKESMNLDKVSASYKDGILSLHIPKQVEAPKEKKTLIDIN